MCKKASLAVFLTLIFWAGVVIAEDAEPRWWPSQKTPNVVYKVLLDNMDVVVGPKGNKESVQFGPLHMLAQSLAGLSAQAVNENRGDEMVWIEHRSGESHRRDYLIWYQDVKKRLGFKEGGEKDVWELVKYFNDKGIIKGYVLYAHDYSKGGVPELREGLDHSANAATVACAVEQGVMISTELEEKARIMGLKKLVDATGRDESWAFSEYKNQLNRKYVLAQDPKIPHHRGIAIANRLMLIFGMTDPTPAIYEWMHKPGGVLGWNVPGEGEFVAQLSEHGHILYASNWCMNLTVTAAGTDDYQPSRKFKMPDPEGIDYSDKSPMISFVMSDGDNVQWLMGDFINNPYYWASPDHGSFPYGWAIPLGSLDQVCPEVNEYLMRTQPDEITFNIHAGGYYMPDLLGKNLPAPERERVIREHSRAVSHYLKKYGIRTTQFICMDLDSDDAIAAYKIMAEEIDDLIGMFALQYAPYEAGDGKVIWVKNKNGVDIPVVTLKYCLWANLNLPQSGTPAKIARLISEDAQAETQKGKQYLNWAMTHAWSGFQKIESNDENAENGVFQKNGHSAGVTPTKWCIDRIDKSVKVITPIEMLWRIRMNHNPEK